MSIVTSSTEKLVVDLAVLGGELTLIPCPQLLLLPQNPFWPHNVRYRHPLSFISGKPMSPLPMSILGYLLQ